MSTDNIDRTALDRVVENAQKVRKSRHDRLSAAQAELRVASEEHEDTVDALVETIAVAEEDFVHRTTPLAEEIDELGNIERRKQELRGRFAVSGSPAQDNDTTSEPQASDNAEPASTAPEPQPDNNADAATNGGSTTVVVTAPARPRYNGRPGTWLEWLLAILLGLFGLAGGWVIFYVIIHHAHQEPWKALLIIVGLILWIALTGVGFFLGGLIGWYIEHRPHREQQLAA